MAECRIENRIFTWLTKFDATEDDKGDGEEKRSFTYIEEKVIMSKTKSSWEDCQSLVNLMEN